MNKLKVDTPVTRSDAWKIHPDDLVVKSENNARYFPHTKKNILSLAMSIAINGQFHAVNVRRTDKGELEIISGYGRQQAVSLINKDAELQKIAEKNNNFKKGVFMLAVSVVKKNDLEAFISSIDENKQNTESSKIDDVHNQKRLKDLGADDADIAKLYGCGVPWLQRNRKLLRLSEDHQRLVHEGKIPLMLAIDFSDLTEEDRNKAIKDCLDGDVVDKKKLKNSTRKNRNKGGKSLGLSISDVRRDFGILTKDPNKEIADLASVVMVFIKGKVDLSKLREAFVKVVED